MGVTVVIILTRVTVTFCPQVEAPFTFAEFDSDGDKTITLTEFSFILGRDDRELREHFWIADTNGKCKKQFYMIFRIIFILRMCLRKNC